MYETRRIIYNIVYRESPFHIVHVYISFFIVRPLQEYYIIAPGHIYQSPDAASVISHRLVTTLFE